MSARPKLLVLNSTCLDVVDENRAWIEAEGVDLVADQRFRNIGSAEAVSLLRDADAVILPAVALNPFGEAQLAAAPRLRCCSIAASGYDWFDVSAATRRGIAVCLAPGGEGSEVVADFTWGLILSVARQIPYHDRAMQEGRSIRGTGVSLGGKTLGILGLGHIGRAVARRAAGFNMRVIAHSPDPDARFVHEHRIEIVSREALLEQADFLSLHLRLTEVTRGTIGDRELRRMKPSAFLINTARQALVDEAALAAAVLEKRIAGAALDDPPGPAGRALAGLPNVIFTPHLGNRAREGMSAVFRLATKNALAVLRGQRPEHVANPEVFAGRKGNGTDLHRAESGGRPSPP